MAHIPSGPLSARPKNALPNDFYRDDRTGILYRFWAGEWHDTAEEKNAEPGKAAYTVPNVPASEATTVKALQADLNALIAALKSAGVMEPDK
jgi:hypothetical protein